MVIISVIELSMAAIVGAGDGSVNLQAFRTVRVFRAFRVLRVTRVLRGLRSMQTIIKVISKSYIDFLLIAALLFLFVLVYTLLG